MSIISCLLSFGAFALGGGVSFVLLRNAHRNYKNWEAGLLARKANIPVATAQKIIKGDLSLEVLDRQAWELAIEYGCDFETACRIQDDQLSLEHYLAQQKSKSQPFVFKPVQKKAPPFHIYEMCHEPAAYINASNANSWAYQNGQDTTHIVLAGHANSLVCKQISSLIYNTYLSMESAEASLLVPGACFLQGTVGVSNLDIKLPMPVTLQAAQKVPPLKEMVGNLQPFQENVGLSTIQVVNNGTYLQIQDKIYALIREAQQKHARVLLKAGTNGHPTRTFLFPFLPLSQRSESPNPLRFELPLYLFESEDFTYLKEVHHQTLILEMTDDALRRKQIYQDWLRQDQENYENYGKYYRSLSPERQQAKDVKISGSRDYVNAVTVNAEEGKESYTSPQEYYEKILPSLLKSDQEWIDKMDALMSSIKSRDRERDDRLNEINLAVLIDSFLRGWPPVFLGGSKEDEGQKRYVNWCKQKRERVWQAIHKRLEAQGMRMEPLLEENTIFQIQFVNDRVISLVPFYVTTDQDMWVYLSSEYGLTFYVNQWSRRKLIKHSLPPKKSNWKCALNYYRKGVEWLDRPGVDKSVTEEEAINRAVNAFKVALETHPAVVQEIWNGWWEHFSRDTSVDFDKFKDLMRAFQAHDEANYEISGYHLKQFISHYPDFLPDPYILLAIQRLQDKTNLAPLLTERRTKITRHTEIKQDIEAKVGFIRSNQALITEILQKKKAKRPLDKFEQQRLGEVERVDKEITGLQLELNQLAGDINEMGQRVEVGYKVIWDTLKSEPDDYLQQARELAPEHIEKILEQRKFIPSDFYLLRFRPLHEILQGDEYIEIANRLHQTSQKLGKKEITVSQLKGEIEDCLRVEYLKKEDLGVLKDFQNKLERLTLEREQVSPIVREIILRKEMDQMAQTYLQNGINKYRQSAYLLPEFSEPVQRITELYTKHQVQYRRALQHMLNHKVPVRNFAPAGKFTPLSGAKFKLNKVWFVRERGIIVGSDKDDNKFDLARAENLTEEETQHLEQELNKPGFLYQKSVGMNSIEFVLNLSIAPSPCSGRWSQALLQMEDWLIRLIAYLDIPPIPSQSLPATYNKLVRKRQRRVDGIDLNPDRIQTQFLQEIGIRIEDVVVVEVEI